MKSFAVAASLLVPAAAWGADGGSVAGAVFQMTASLAIVIGLIYLAYYAATRWFKGMAGGTACSPLIRVVETRHLAPKRSLVIVEVAGEYLLLGNGGEGVQLLKKLENIDELATLNGAAPLRPVPELFRKTLDDMLGKIRGGLAARGKGALVVTSPCASTLGGAPMTVAELMKEMEVGEREGGLERCTEEA